MAFVITNAATKMFIGPKKGDQKYTLVPTERGARVFSCKDRAAKAMKGVIKYFGDDLPWQVIDMDDVTFYV